MLSGTRKGLTEVWCVMVALWACCTPPLPQRGRHSCPSKAHLILAVSRAQRLCCRAVAALTAAQGEGTGTSPRLSRRAFPSPAARCHVGSRTRVTPALKGGSCMALHGSQRGLRGRTHRSNTGRGLKWNSSCTTAQLKSSVSDFQPHECSRITVVAMVMEPITSLKRDFKRGFTSDNLWVSHTLETVLNLTVLAYPDTARITGSWSNCVTALEARRLRSVQALAVTQI